MTTTTPDVMRLQNTIIGLNADINDAHADLRRMLRALGLSDAARPISAHAVVETKILPLLTAYRDLEAAARSKTPCKWTWEGCPEPCGCWAVDRALAALSTIRATEGNVE